MQSQLSSNWTKSGWIFLALLCFLILDRILTLVHFGFVYADIDQAVMWNGALDYSKGIFKEPFFYGQPYNYMLEALLAVPLLWLSIPVFEALPMATSFIALLPFVVLAVMMRCRGFYFWALVSLAFPIFLSLYYNFLTTISRGFVQAYLFIPLLFIPLFDPTKKRNVTILFLVCGISFIANQSSLLIIIPIVTYLWAHHYSSRSFYLKSLLVIPFVLMDQQAKRFYELHPERVLHRMNGIDVSLDTFLSSLSNSNMFEGLFPFFPNYSFLYVPTLIILALIAWKKGRTKEMLFVCSTVMLLVGTFAIPKFQETFGESGVFFTPVRLYTYLPLLLLLSLFLVFRGLKKGSITTIFLLIIVTVSFILKNKSVEEKAATVYAETLFPVIEIENLVERTEVIQQIVNEHDIDLIIHSTFSGWDYVFDSYAYRPFTMEDQAPGSDVISVNVDGDRRSWLFSASTNRKRILLNGLKVDTVALKEFQHEILNDKHIVVDNNLGDVSELMNALGYKYGNEL